MNALNLQLRRDVAPTLGVYAPILDYYETSPGMVSNATVVQLMDDPDMPGADGYHDEDPYGNAFDKIFLRPTINSGGSICTGPNSISVTLSHELIETIGDEHVQLWAQNYKTNDLYSYELCDPVEMDGNYVLDGVSVSNFVTGDWFDAFARPQSQFDFLKNLKAPFTLTKGGYMTLWNAQGQKQVYGEEYPEWRKEMKAISRRIQKRTQKK